MKHSSSGHRCYYKNISIIDSSSAVLKLSCKGSHQIEIKIIEALFVHASCSNAGKLSCDESVSIPLILTLAIASITSIKFIDANF